ncbi:heme oxygenase-like protein [Westerdykella ornata]|uniref:Heme oxygenase-like protein n=1 Tax=Westerdykella ornata TaxID=318751 RepID=A0A6A6J9S8_WESOR|nr:heme oxygenase-like protein [Westerdykella ornata]KAF2272738.1 heme oxygenase-like protein [Westerdykella ornata]
MPPPPSNNPQTLTAHLLSLFPAHFTAATQTPFLRAAATNALPKPLLDKWLANDLLYMRAYIKLAGYLLQILDLPAAAAAARPAPAQEGNETEIADSISHRLVDWLVDALVNIRREERFFASVATKYNIDISLAASAPGTHASEVDDSLKIAGLRKFEALVGDLTSHDDGKMGEQQQQRVLPWLEGAVLFWATEKVYLTAWRWAAEQAGGAAVSAPQGGAEVLDVMKTEFIPNWTNDEFVEFVETLERIVNDGVREAVGGDQGKWEDVMRRAEGVWRRVLDAEADFWPEVAHV